ncbi:ribonuclease HI family protein [Candidatus Gottesmanbacteria bacterium]|nr:ribonuclease HI family protein [Candidatus Gottesmanbacteria bacterium]
MQFIVHTDGGARGNPGPAAVGVVIEIYQSDQFTNPTNEKPEIIEFGKRIGETTNNVAEYRAVLSALHEIKNQKPKIKNADEKSKIEIQFFLDSNLVVQQLNGNFKVKDARLRGLMMQVKILEQEIGGMVTYTYIPREQNTRADWLVNRALDHAG